MPDKKYSAAALVLIAGLALFVYYTQQPAPAKEYKQYEGTVFGTVYHIAFAQDPRNPISQSDIEKELEHFDASLSTFNPKSTISLVNQGKLYNIRDQWFINVFNESKRVSNATEGAFDITVAPLVNAWGFGFKKKKSVTPTQIDSIRQFVGIEKIKLENGKITKSDDRLMLDASAIAKGYACDIVGEYLKKQGVTSFMVEIGGEIYCEGKSKKNADWVLGINKPIEDETNSNFELQTAIKVSGKGVATSGNYRNFYYKDGKKYAHTINPHTGYPIEHNLLSATVVAKNCMTADAYATAFMVLGLERSMAIVENDPDLEAIFICAADTVTNKAQVEVLEFQMITSSGMKKYIAK